MFLGLFAAWVLLRVLPSDQRLHDFEADPAA